jgi:hypothetical protein
MNEAFRHHRHLGTRGDLMGGWLVGGCLALILFGIIKRNIWYRQDRTTMTDDERRQHDEEMHIPGDW